MRSQATPIQFWTHLKREDPALVSARMTLELDLGWKGSLVDMDLWGLWELGCRGQAVAEGAQALAEAALLANPNKERIWVRLPGEAPGPPEVPEPGAWYWCLVWDREGPTPEHAWRLCQRLLERHRLGAEYLVRAAVWGLRWSPEVGDPLEAAREVGWAVSRRRGLLANPHAQALQIFHREVPLPWWPPRGEEPLPADSGD
jgi:hypothetical protein